MERGIPEGEEVLNHYCDVELDVRQRREWAVGTLGVFVFVKGVFGKKGKKTGSRRTVGRKNKE